MRARFPLRGPLKRLPNSLRLRNISGSASTLAEELHTPQIHPKREDIIVQAQQSASSRLGDDEVSLSNSTPSLGTPALFSSYPLDDLKHILLVGIPLLSVTCRRF